MSDYDNVQRELDNGTPAELLCATCPWMRPCVSPPSMSKKDLDRMMAEARAKDAETSSTRPGTAPMQELLTAVTLGGRDRSGALCPVFALRLTGPDGRDVADGIRKMMRDGVGGAR